MEPRVREYIVETARKKYHRGSKKEKGEVLDDICEQLGCHRKHAIRLMKKLQVGRKPNPKKRGPKSKYDEPRFLKALYKVRRVMEFRATEVIKESMPEWLPYIEQHYGKFDEDVREKLLTISASTMKRKLKRLREQNGKGLSTTRPGSILRTEIPISTRSPWDDTIPGKMATDCVAHCGNSTAGQYINSLDMVDPVTHWTAQRAVWGKGSSGVLEATKDIEESLPFPMVGLHVDNGTEFLNYHYVRYFTQEPKRTDFSFTRSRAYHKNDNCHVEQKNWSVVRRYFGYDRLDSQELVALMNDVYANELYLYLNHFCRTFKLCQKIAIKSRYKRIYGKPQTPYQRVLESTHISSDSKNSLIQQHDSLDPVALKLKVERKLKNIYALHRSIIKSRQNSALA